MYSIVDESNAAQSFMYGAIHWIASYGMLASIQPAYSSPAYVQMYMLLDGR